jgi:lactam utilization protein B
MTYDESENLKDISFVNSAKTENWQRSIELNKSGNVSCYIDKSNDLILQSLCMIYHDNDPQAKNMVETITTTFEKDGISYYQKNNTTGKIRTRNRMTLEWSPWK